MNPLPQRKKSADEIAKLREAMGIPAERPIAGDSVRQEPDSASTLNEQPLPEFHAATAPPAEAARPVRSLKRSERTSAVLAEVEDTPKTQPQTGKIVRSLRKSEQVPIVLVENHTPPAHSDLPVHRHSEEELARIRRQGMIQMQGAAVVPVSQVAHLAVVIPGYFFALAGAVSFYFYNLSISLTAGAALLAAAIAGYIFVKKPFSRYHAAFIAAIVLLVIVFGALHYFPQLRHGT